MTTLRIPADIPLSMLVAAPLLDASAICATGRDDVKYSEARPMRTPDTTPTVTALPAFMSPNTPRERGIETATSATEAPIDPYRSRDSGENRSLLDRSFTRSTAMRENIKPAATT